MGNLLSVRAFDSACGAAHGETAAETARRQARAVDTVRGYRRDAIAAVGARSMAQAVYILAPLISKAVLPERPGVQKGRPYGKLYRMQAHDTREQLGTTGDSVKPGEGRST